jgi:hypothetical protein
MRCAPCGCRVRSLRASRSHTVHRARSRCTGTRRGQAAAAHVRGGANLQQAAVQLRIVWNITAGRCERTPPAASDRTDGLLTIGLSRCGCGGAKPAILVFFADSITADAAPLKAPDVHLSGRAGSSSARRRRLIRAALLLGAPQPLRHCG